jgi:hypothetical protein
MYPGSGKQAQFANGKKFCLSLILQPSVPRADLRFPVSEHQVPVLLTALLRCRVSDPGSLTMPQMKGTVGALS